MKIKVCGNTPANDLKAYLQIAVDMLGFIFYPPSARNVDDKINELSETLPAIKQKRVGVFVNPDRGRVYKINEQLNLDIVQLHGEESPKVCRELSSAFSIMKAFRLSSSFDFEVLREYEEVCDYFLFDTKGPLPGGNGVPFDWSILGKYTLSKPFFLSGGIHPGMADQIRKFKHPAFSGIDINSGFEFKPGHKNMEAISNFINQLKLQT